MNLKKLFNSRTDKPQSILQLTTGLLGMMVVALFLVVAHARTQENSLRVTSLTEKGVGEVEVKLTEHKIDMPTSVSAGTTIFKVTNAGKMEHNFEVEGSGVEKKFDDDLKPGETQTMQLDLKAGTYKVYCPVGDHAQKGMMMKLTVTQ